MNILWYLVLLVLGCAAPEKQLQDVAALRTQLNQGVGKIAGLDSILCKHPYGGEGILYFDDVLWTHLSPEVRRRTTECLDLQRGLRVRHPAPVHPPVRIWSARIDELNNKLYIGWLQSDCPACDLDEKNAQYHLRWADGQYQATEIPSGQIWR